MMEALQFDFMQNALLAGLMVSIACGIIGTLVVVNRIVFISGGVAHAAYGGIGLAFYLDIPYMVGTLGFSLLAGMIMAAVTLKDRHRSDTIIGVIWATGMATGIILLDMTPGYNVDLMSYLFGSILTVPASDLKFMLGVTLLILIITAFLYKDFFAMSYDPEHATIRGIPVRFLHFLLVGLIAVSVVMIIQVVGLILVIALLTIPPYIAEKYSDSLMRMMVISTILSAVFILSGLFLSYRLDLSTGAVIIMVGAAAFFFSAAVDRIRHHMANIRLKNSE